MLKKQVDNELIKALKAIEVNRLSEDDKEELVSIFINTKNHAIRNRLALIFSDILYQPAAPHLAKKMKDKALINRTGTLVHCLGYLDSKKYFIDFIIVICEQEYEARLMAFGIIERLLPSISKGVKNRALKLLNEYHQSLTLSGVFDGNNSTLHFIDATVDVLEGRDN